MDITTTKMLNHEKRCSVFPIDCSDYYISLAQSQKIEYICSAKDRWQRRGATIER